MNPTLFLALCPKPHVLAPLSRQPLVPFYNRRGDPQSSFLSSTSSSQCPEAGNCPQQFHPCEAISPSVLVTIRLAITSFLHLYILQTTESGFCLDGFSPALGAHRSLFFCALLYNFLPMYFIQMQAKMEDGRVNKPRGEGGIQPPTRVYASGLVTRTRPTHLMTSRQKRRREF